MRRQIYMQGYRPAKYAEDFRAEGMLSASCCSVHAACAGKAHPYRKAGARHARVKGILTADDLPAPADTLTTMAQ